MPGDASSALEMTKNGGGTQSFSISHLESSPHSIPSSKNARISPREVRKRGVNALGYFCLVVGQHLVKEGVWGINIPPPKLAVTVQ